MTTNRYTELMRELLELEEPNCSSILTCVLTNGPYRSYSTLHCFLAEAHKSFGISHLKTLIFIDRAINQEFPFRETTLSKWFWLARSRPKEFRVVMEAAIRLAIESESTVNL